MWPPGSSHGKVVFTFLWPSLTACAASVAHLQPEASKWGLWCRPAVGMSVSCCWPHPPTSPFLLTIRLSLSLPPRPSHPPQVLCVLRDASSAPTQGPLLITKCPASLSLVPELPKQMSASILLSAPQARWEGEAAERERWVRPEKKREASYPVFHHH